MKLTLLIAIALFHAGCASVQLSSVRPDYSGLKTVPAEERQTYYEKMKIAEVKGDYARIGSDWYGRYNLKHIYKATGATEARRWANRSMAKKIALIIAPSVSVGLGTYIGLYYGAVKYQSSATTEYYTADGKKYSRTHYDHADASIIYQSALVGMGIGMVAAGIEYLILRRATTTALEKSASIFNQHLLKSLNLQVSPESGGVKAGVSQAF